MQRLLKKSVRFGLHHCGGLAIVKSLYRSKLRILFYHRFQASDRDWTSEFETQCRHLRKRYSPLSLTQAAIHIRDHKPFPPNAVVVTVDDGYRDFGTVAYPILARYGIPATIYVVANFIENNEWLWWDRIWYCLRHTPYNSFRVRLPAGSDLQLSLQGEAARESAAEVLSEALKSLPNQEM